MKKLFLLLMLVSTNAVALEEGSPATLSECIAEASAGDKAGLLECVKNRDADKDSEDDHAVLKCLISGDDKKIFWFEDCIHG